MLPGLERVEAALFFGSRSMPAPWGPLLRFVRYPAALARDWLSGEINIRAMSLAYTTLLSLVPLLVFSFAILKALGAHGDLRFLLNEFFAPMGGAAPQLTASVLTFVANMRGELLGAIGLGFLIYTVIATVQKVEGSFNFVWRVARPRSFGRRFTEYLSIMTFGPLLLAVALALLGAAQRTALIQRIAQLPALAAFGLLLGQVVPYLIVAAVFTCMYAFIPNTRVEARAALIGGATAGIIWALVGRLFTTFIFYFSHMMAVYTGFAFVLTTLIWVYLSWLILLIGAQLAFYVQFPQYLPHGQRRVSLGGRDAERAALSIMVLLGSGHEAGARFDATRLGAALGIPGIALAPVLARLERAGLIVATEREYFVPGRDSASILLTDIIGAARNPEWDRHEVEVQGVEPAAHLMAKLDGAMRRELGSASLKDVIDGRCA